LQPQSLLLRHYLKVIIWLITLNVFQEILNFQMKVYLEGSVRFSY
jgi:hypothetical protein